MEDKIEKIFQKMKQTEKDLGNSLNKKNLKN